jgi:hypothetical protein
MIYTNTDSRTDWLVEQLWPEDRPEGRAIWAILDGARDSRIYDLVRYSRMERACLYAGNHPEELLHAAPHLIRLTPGTQFARELLGAAWGKSWGIFLSTRAALDTLRFHLRGFLRVRDQSGRKLVFRYYDPRVFRDYLPTCTSGELEMVFGPIDSFIAEGRDGTTLLRFQRERGALATRSFVMPVPSMGTPAASRAVTR